MGQTTPNIGIYIPAAGETNYADSFASGMVNIDQHDHSGGPNKGVPIGNSGIADGSVTYDKLNANVADNTTGIGTSSTLLNQLQILGLLKNIFQISTSTGFIAKNGSLANARTFQNTSSIVWTNADGSGGDPSASLANGITTGVVGTANQINVSAAVAGIQTISLPANVVNINQSAFSASATLPQNAVTGDGTDYKVLFGTVLFNQGSNYNSSTSTFVAPITGIYTMGLELYMQGGSSSTNKVEIDFYVNGVSAYTIFFGNTGPILINNGGNLELNISGSQLMKLNSSDQVTVHIIATTNTSSKVIGIVGGTFTGILEC